MLLGNKIENVYYDYSFSSNYIRLLNNKYKKEIYNYFPVLNEDCLTQKVANKETEKLFFF